MIVRAESQPDALNIWDSYPWEVEDSKVHILSVGATKRNILVAFKHPRLFIDTILFPCISTVAASSGNVVLGLYRGGTKQLISSASVAWSRTARDHFILQGDIDPVVLEPGISWMGVNSDNGDLDCFTCHTADLPRKFFTGEVNVDTGGQPTITPVDDMGGKIQYGFLSGYKNGLALPASLPDFSADGWTTLNTAPMAFRLLLKSAWEAWVKGL